MYLSNLTAYCVYISVFSTQLYIGIVKSFLKTLNYLLSNFPNPFDASKLLSAVLQLHSSQFYTEKKKPTKKKKFGNLESPSNWPIYIEHFHGYILLKQHDLWTIQSDWSYLILTQTMIKTIVVWLWLHECSVFSLTVGWCPGPEARQRQSRRTAGEGSRTPDGLLQSLRLGQVRVYH